MEPGGFPGLQNLGGALSVLGGFDSHTLPPLSTGGHTAPVPRIRLGVAVHTQRWSRLMEQAHGDALRSTVPEWIKRPIRDLRNALFNGTRAMIRGAGAPFYYGTGRICPICKRASRRFRPYGLIRREE